MSYSQSVQLRFILDFIVYASFAWTIKETYKILFIPLLLDFSEILFPQLSLRTEKFLLICFIFADT